MFDSDKDAEDVESVLGAPYLHALDEGVQNTYDPAHPASAPCPDDLGKKHDEELGRTERFYD